MSITQRLIRAAHAKGTHHWLALDALGEMEGQEAKRWQNLFYYHAEAYLQGSKAPDTDFKDYKNHVLHVRDGYWGGATGACREWYDRLVYNLKTQNWHDAVYSAGVLSHYYNDALHPFHTAQSEAESNIHRATEWSISRSYAFLKENAGNKWPEMTINIPEGKEWLERLVEQNAGFANQYYEGLIAHYNFEKGVVEPEEGLDPHAQEIVSWLLRYAALSFAVVLERAIAEAGAKPKDYAVTMEAFLSGLSIPLVWVLRKMEDRAERHLVEAIYDELHATGGVELHLPEDDRVIRDLYEKEVLAKRNHWNRQQESTVQLVRQPREEDTVIPVRKGSRSNVEVERKRVQKPEEKAYFLSRSSPVTQAPYIGRRTAKRLSVLGILTVGDFLKFSPEQIVETIHLRRVTARDIRCWQAVARLMCEVPRLKAFHAKVLAGLQIESVHQLAEVRPQAMLEMMARFAQSDEGRTLLKGKKLPDPAELLQGVQQHSAPSAKESDLPVKTGRVAA